MLPPAPCNVVSTVINRHKGMRWAWAPSFASAFRAAERSRRFRASTASRRTGRRSRACTSPSFSTMEALSVLWTSVVVGGNDGEGGARVSVFWRFVVFGGGSVASAVVVAAAGARKHRLPLQAGGDAGCFAEPLPLWNLRGVWPIATYTTHAPNARIISFFNVLNRRSRRAGCLLPLGRPLSGPSGLWRAIAITGLPSCGALAPEIYLTELRLHLGRGGAACARRCKCPL
mmetsp:Transcript_12198/g.29571  ORF Transcript_12198/g.29571 Transcript_12198/m.29571 type:complete len:230 (-) Transcript_12198:107-796(-)